MIELLSFDVSMQNGGVTFLRAPHAKGEKQGREFPQKV